MSGLGDNRFSRDNSSRSRDSSSAINRLSGRARDDLFQGGLKHQSQQEGERCKAGISSSEQGLQKRSFDTFSQGSLPLDAPIDTLSQASTTHEIREKLANIPLKNRITNDSINLKFSEHDNILTKENMNEINKHI